MIEIFIFFYGLCFGSFANVVAYRLPLMMQREWESEINDVVPGTFRLGPAISLSLPRSRCNKCGHQIRWYENVPVLSYLFLKGRCSSCKTSIGRLYPAVELFLGVVFVLIYLKLGLTLEAAILGAVSFALLVLALIDRAYLILPDPLVYSVLWLGMLHSALYRASGAMEEVILTVSVTYLVLWGLSEAAAWWYKQGVFGRGDVKLMAAFAAWLSPIELLYALCVGALLLTVFNFSARGSAKEIPFGPYLIVGALYSYCVGDYTTDLIFRI
ncbi:prepilin peptidase [Vibrio mediterranei]|uniref:prepilin peptidase n=1 Tax=Vibrio mediterranei TaxID=689 RepID=UPI00406811E4